MSNPSERPIEEQIGLEVIRDRIKSQTCIERVIPRHVLESIRRKKLKPVLSIRELEENPDKCTIFQGFAVKAAHAEEALPESQRF